MKRILAVTAAVAVCSTFVFADGLQVGSSVSAFYVKDVTGPAAGTKLCYRCRYGDRPVVSIFARDTKGEVATLIKEVDGVVGKHKDKDMAGFVVLMSDQPEAHEGDLKKIADDSKISNVPLTTFEGAAGPTPYKIPQDADVTVMMWVDGTLKVSKSFKSSELSKDKISAVVSEAKQILN